MIRRIAAEVLTAAGNGLLFLVALAAGVRVVYPVVFAALKLGRVEPGFQAGLGEYQVMVLSMSIAFATFAVLSRLWTRHVMNVAVVSGAFFIVGMVLLGQAMYLADEGDPSMMWAYVRPQVPQYLGALWCAAAATLGWYAGGMVWRKSRLAAEETQP